MKRRITSIILCVLLIIGTIPCRTYAAPAEVAVNDPRFADQPYLKNSPSDEEQTGVSAVEGWSELADFVNSHEEGKKPEDCKPVRVAVLDSGIDGTHEDLKNRVTAGWDIVNDCVIEAGANSDITGHGTAVAGLIAAEADNEKGIAGAAYTFPVQLIPVRVLDNNNRASGSDIAKAIKWAVDEGKADIINMSFGVKMDDEPEGLRNAVAYALNKGVVLFAAAGNNGMKYAEGKFDTYPAAITGVISVGSLQNAPSVVKNYQNIDLRQPEPADFSNRPLSLQSPMFESEFYFVPGENLLSTAPDDTYQTFNGTSASCALLCGFYAAMQSALSTVNGGDARKALAYEKVFAPSSASTPYFSFSAAGYAVNHSVFKGEWIRLKNSFPAAARDTVTIEGVFSDLENNGGSMELRLQNLKTLDEYTADTVACNGSPVQYFSFTVDTASYVDGEYCWSILQVTDSANACVRESGKFYIDNNHQYYSVKVQNNDVPISAEYVLKYENGEVVEGYGQGVYKTDEAGEFIVSKALAEAEPLVFCSSTYIDNHYVRIYEKLGTPDKGVIDIMLDPVEFKVDSTGVFDMFKDRSVSISLNETTYDITIGLYQEISDSCYISASVPVTVYLNNKDTYLKRVYDFDSDTVWKLAEETDNCGIVEFVPDGEAAGFIGEISLNERNSLCLTADSTRKIRLSEGEYNLMVYVIKGADNYYFGADLGKYTVKSGESSQIPVGCTVSGELSCTPESPREFDDYALNYYFRDSQNRNIMSFGKADISDWGTSMDFLYGKFTVQKEGGSSAEYSYYDIDVSESGQFTAEFYSNIFAEAGNYTVKFKGSSVLPELSCNITVRPEETRPYAKVYPSFKAPYKEDGEIKFDEYNDTDVYAMLTDVEKNLIIRKNNSYDAEKDTYYVKLPIGDKYPVLAIEQYNGECIAILNELDLTAASEGESVKLESLLDNSFVLKSVYCENGSAEKLFIKPFDNSEAAVMLSGTDIRSKNLGKVPCLIYFRDYEHYENYYLTEAEIDLSSADAFYLGNEITRKLKTDKNKYVQGDAIKISCDFSDSYGNRIKDITKQDGSEYVSRKAVFVLYDSLDKELKRVNSSVADGAEFDNLAEGSYSVRLVMDGFDPVSVSFAIGENGPQAIASLKPPKSITAKLLENDNVLISWSESENGCSGYCILRDGVEIKRVAADCLSITDNATEANRYYVYEIASLDSEGRPGATRCTGIRTSTVDNEAPSAPANLKASIEGTSVVLRWDRARDNIGIAGYILKINGEEMDMTVSRSYTIERFMPGASISASVCAADTSGNRSEYTSLTVDNNNQDTVLDSIKLNIATNRLGLATDNKFTITAKTTADVTSAKAEVEYTGENGTETVWFDMTDDGTRWTADGEIAFFTSIERVTVHAYAGAVEKKSDVLEGNPLLKKAGYLIVNLKDRPNNSDIDLSGCLVTVSSKNAGFAVSETAADWTGSLYFNICEGDDFELKIQDRDGVPVYSRKGIRNDSTLDAGCPNVMSASINSSVRLDGQKVTVYDGAHKNIIVTGEVNSNNEIVFSNGKKWFCTDGYVNSNVIFAFDSFEQKKGKATVIAEAVEIEKYVYGGAEKETLLRNTYQLSSREYSVVVSDGNAPLTGVSVNFATDYGAAAVKTDENGRAKINLNYFGSLLCTAAVNDIQINGTAYQGSSVNIREGETEKTLILKQCISPVKAAAEIRVFENGQYVPVGKSEFAGAGISYSINGYSCSVNGAGELICRNMSVLTGDRLTLSVTLTSDNKEYSAEKTITAVAGSGVQSFGQVDIRTDMAKVTIKLQDSLSARYRYLVFREDTKEKVADVISSDKAVISLPSDVQLAFFVTAETDTDYSFDDMLLKYSPVRKRFSEGEKAEVSFRLASSLFADKEIAENVAENYAVGFTHVPEVTWLSDGSVWVQLDLIYTPAVFSKLGECSTMINIPREASEIKVTDNEAATYDISKKEKYTQVKITPEDNECSSRHYITIGFKLGEEYTENSQSASQLVYSAGTGVNNTFTVSNRTINFNPVTVSCPERISGTAAEDGMFINVNSGLADNSGWIFSVYDGSRLVYSSELDKTGTRVHIPIDAKLHYGTLYTVVSRDQKSYSDVLSYEVVDDSRPVLLSATLNGGDITDLSTSLSIKRVHPSMDVKAAFSNPEKVTNVRLRVYTQCNRLDIPLEYAAADNIFTNSFMLVGDNWVITEAELLWDEIIDRNTVYGELSAAAIDTLQLSIPEGCVFEAVPSQYGGSSTKQTDRLAKWKRYLNYIENDIFVSGTESQQKSAVEDLFSEDGVWYLPTYKTPYGEYITVRYEITDVIPNGSVSLAVDGEKRMVFSEIKEKKYSGTNGGISGLSLESYGLCDFLFPIEKKEAVRAQWTWSQEHEGWFKDKKAKYDLGKQVVDYVKVADDLIFEVDLSKREDVDRAIDELTGLLPYSDGNEDVAVLVKLTVDAIQERDRLDKKMLCDSGDIGFCEKDDDDGDRRRGDDGKNGSGGGADGSGNDRSRGRKRIRTLIDPSGYVFEVNENERLEGVTATIYQKLGDSWYKWDPRPFGEPENPSDTDAAGAYGWNTLSGEWKVVFEKEGYYRAESETLQVPPEHLDVNISMVSSAAPKPAEILAFSDGRTLRLSFDRYMTVDSVAAEGMIKAYLGSSELKLSVTPFDETFSTAGNKQNNELNGIVPGISCSKVFYITLEDELPAGAGVKLVISGECMGYNLLSIGKDTVANVLIPDNDPVIAADRIMPDGEVYHDMKPGEKLTLKVKPVFSDSNEKVSWSSSDSTVAAVDADGVVTAAGAGSAIITASVVNGSVSFEIRVQRTPVLQNTSDFSAKFCRSENLIVSKRCWLSSVSVAEAVSIPVAGDVRYIPIAWSISEDGVVKASADLAYGETEVQVPYYPEKTGASCCGSIVYGKQIYDGFWKSTGDTYTANVTLPVVQVTALYVKAVPSFKSGDVFSLKNITMGVKLSDGRTSEFGIEKFSSYRLEFSISEGAVITDKDNVLKITHSETGISTEYKLFDVNSGNSGSNGNSGNSGNTGNSGFSGNSGDYIIPVIPGDSGEKDDDGKDTGTGAEKDTSGKQNEADENDVKDSGEKKDTSEGGIKEKTVIKKGVRFTAEDGNSYVITAVKGRNGAAVNTVRLISYGKTGTRAVIPDTVNVNGKSFRITLIDKKAFRNNTKLRTVVLGKYVSEILPYQFSSCRNLKSVKMNSRLVSIGKFAFYGCKSLKSVTIPARVKSIGYKAFYGCSSLRKLVIESTRLTAEGIGRMAFKGIADKAVVYVPAGRLKKYTSMFGAVSGLKNAKIK